MKKRSDFWTPLHLVTGNDIFRQKMMYVYFYEGKIWATDTHVAYRIDASAYGLDNDQIRILEGKCLSRKQLSKIWNKKTIVPMITEEGILDYETNSVFKYYSIDKVSEGSKIVPEMIKDLIDLKYEKEEPRKIGINPTLLENIKKCFGCKILHLDITAANRAIICKPSNDDSGNFLGIVMPSMIWEY